MNLTRLRKWPLFFDSRKWTKRDLGQARKPARGRIATTAASAFVAHDRFKTSTGTRVVHSQQYFSGLRVYGSAIVTTLRGARKHVTPAMFGLPRSIDPRPAVPPDTALQTAIGFLIRRRSLTKNFKLKVKSVSRAGHVENQVSFVDASTLARPACLHLEIFPRPGRRASLAWVAEICFKDLRRFHAVISADQKRPRVLLLAQVNTCAFSAQWVPEPPALVETATFPLPVITTPSGAGAAASGWQSTTGFAMGPNVNCIPSASTTIEALGTLPVDNAFVWCNLVHDLFASFGFDAAHFAFEADDPLRVLRFSGKKAVAGEFDNRADGVEPRMMLYGSPHGGGHHAATDPTIVVHEYVHGMTSRLIGGSACPTPFVTVESLGLSEGYSDFFALTVVNYVGRKRGAGGGSVTRIGERFKPGGLRNYGGFTNTVPSGSSDPHKFGMPWCAGLLDARGRIAVTTSEDGADRFLWLACIDSLKTMAPLCHTTNSLTLAHAKSALLAAARRLATGTPALSGAEAAIDLALTARGI